MIAEETKKKPSRPSPFCGAPLTYPIRVTNTANRAHRTTTYNQGYRSTLNVDIRTFLHKSIGTCSDAYRVA